MFGGRVEELTPPPARRSDLRRDAPVQLSAEQVTLRGCGVRSGVTNPCRMRETTEVWASKVRVRP